MRKTKPRYRLAGQLPSTPMNHLEPTSLRHCKSDLESYPGEIRPSISQLMGIVGARTLSSRLSFVNMSRGIKPYCSSKGSRSFHQTEKESPTTRSNILMPAQESRVLQRAFLSLWCAFLKTCETI